MSDLLDRVPWDSEAFGFPAWELREFSPAALDRAVRTPGHHTVRVPPLADKKLLHECGFYYCDSLIQPRCTAGRLREWSHPDATVAATEDRASVLDACHGAFVHGRFHRDFNIPRNLAELRYERWLCTLLDQRQVLGLYWQGRPCGFIAWSGGALVLHAVSAEMRGKGLAKFWWSAACRDLVRRGRPELTSSVSATNLPALNLYASLGFSFGEVCDVYHLRVK